MKKKITILVSVIIPLLLVSGYLMPRTNWAIARNISQLDGMYNGDSAHDRELVMKQEMLRRKLLYRGYLERRRVLLDVKGFSSGWKEVHLKVRKFLNTRTCKVAYVQIRPSSTERDYIMALMIWDRPSSMKDWDAFIQTLSTNQANQRVEITITTPPDRW